MMELHARLVFWHALPAVCLAARKLAVLCCAVLCCAVLCCAVLWAVEPVLAWCLCAPLLLYP
jgi:hypothetical protein